MKCFEYYVLALVNTFDFKGRARRYEYFSFLLGNFFILFSLAMLDQGFGIMVLAPIWQVVIILPSISVAIRRAHDSNHSGWFILLPLYNLALMFFNSKNKDNRFGANPRKIEDFEVHP